MRYRLQFRRNKFYSRVTDPRVTNHWRSVTKMGCTNKILGAPIVKPLLFLDFLQKILKFWEGTWPSSPMHGQTAFVTDLNSSHNRRKILVLVVHVGLSRLCNVQKQYVIVANELTQSISWCNRNMPLCCALLWFYCLFRLMKHREGKQCKPTNNTLIL